MANPGGLRANQPRTFRVSVKEFMAKYKTKREVYHFCTVDAKLYVPPYETVTMWHLRDVATNKKRRILAKDAEHMEVPQYEELSIEKMIIWLKENHPVFLENYFPVEREMVKFPRQVSRIRALSQTSWLRGHNS